MQQACAFEEKKNRKKKLRKNPPHPKHTTKSISARPPRATRDGMRCLFVFVFFKSSRGWAKIRLKLTLPRIRNMSWFDLTHAPVATSASAAATGLVSMSIRPDLEGSGTVDIAIRRCPRLRVVWDLRELTHQQKPRLWSLPARLGPVTVHPTHWGVGPRKHVPRVSPYSPDSIDPGFAEIGLVQLSQSVKTTKVTHTRTHIPTDNLNIGTLYAPRY